MTKVIHVNRHHIAANAKDGGNRPVYTVKDRGTTRYAREVMIDGPSKLVYNGKQLSCGARAYIVTESPLTLIDEMSFSEAKESL
jgi:phage terminase large subunit-like protein